MSGTESGSEKESVRRFPVWWPINVGWDFRGNNSLLAGSLSPIAFFSAFAFSHSPLSLLITQETKCGVIHSSRYEPFYARGNEGVNAKKINQLNG